MRRQQRIQLLQFIAAWVLIYLFCHFVIKQSFADVILKHWLLFLIASISYFYYYSILYEPDKKYRLIRGALIGWNIYLFAHVFFRPLLNIPDELFFLLWLIILWFWWTTKMRSRWKYLLQGLWFIFSFFILLSGLFYFYPDKPDIDWFIASRKYELSWVWFIERVDKRDAYIEVKDTKKIEDYEIGQWFVRVLSDSCEISYPSNKIERDWKIILMTPEWEIFWIFPQSKIEVQFSWNTLVKLSKITGKVGVLSWVFEESTEFIWNFDELPDEEISELKNLQDGYKRDLVLYLKEQISDSNISLANGTIMYDIDGRILRFLARMFPTSFWKNLKNYNEFMNYFSWVNDEVDLSIYSNRNMPKWSIRYMLRTMKEGIKIGKQDTYLLKKY